MPYFKNNDENILFIHIPKTGGTSLESYFSSKLNIELNNESLFLSIDKKIKLKNNMIINSSLQHLTYKNIVEYNKVFNIDFNNIKIITIVRKPYERIISDLFYYNKINQNSNKINVYLIIKKYILSNNYDNHNIPQYMFITDDNKNLIPNINILHTETLKNDMIMLGYKDFNVFNNQNINKKNINYYDYLNNESIMIINDFYDLDFKIFNYPKIYKI
jgi:hypothetical protein